MFKQGKEIVEVTYGTQHPLFAQFSSAMGQAKLKTKYETPGEVRRNKSRSPSSDDSPGSKRIGRKKSTNKLNGKPLASKASKH